MNLIWGGVSSDGDAVATHSKTALAVMSALARGEGRIYSSSGVTLAQFSSSSATPSDGTLSLRSYAELYRIVVDSRLDNRQELCHTFGWSDVGLISDEHLILEAYRRWGENCPEHLLGDFAFAIWNTREKHLFCARDHLGIKPFIIGTTVLIFVLPVISRAF
jgi:asparagine synthase (glutamine-hydrolysing)